MNPDDLDALLPSGLPGADAPKGDQSEFAGWLKAVKAVLKEAPVIHVKDVSPKTIELDSLAMLSDLDPEPKFSFDDLIVGGFSAGDFTSTGGSKSQGPSMQNLPKIGKEQYLHLIKGKPSGGKSAFIAKMYGGTPTTLLSAAEAKKTVLAEPSTFQTFLDDFYGRMAAYPSPRRFVSAMDAGDPVYYMNPGSGSMVMLKGGGITVPADVKLDALLWLVYEGKYLEVME